MQQYDSEPLVGEWSLGGFRTRWMQWGSGVPDIVGIHGFAASTRTWHMVAPRLQRAGYSVLSVGLPYHADEQPAELPDLNVVRFAEALTATLRSLHVEQVTLLAHSFGCRVATAAVVTDPALFRELIMVAPGGFRSAEDFTFGLLKVFPFSWMLNGTALVRFILSRLVPDVSAEKRDQAVEIYRKLVSSYPGTSPASVGLLGLLKVYPGRVLLVFGENDRMVPPRFAGKIERLFTSAESVVIADGGHVPMLHQPEAFFAAIVTFLRKRNQR
jgi:pimeloyl-ACP methyl ester carboxylesterase